MIRSMTGFGRAAFEVDGISLEVEIRTVNHRHLDLRVRLPKGLADAEVGLKAKVQPLLQRGKVDLTVAPARGVAPAPELKVDGAVVEQLLAAARELSEEHGLEGSLRIAELLALPGVTRTVEREPAPEALLLAFEGALAAALQGVDRMRVTEGTALERELTSRLAILGTLLAEVEVRAESVVETARERLRRRTKKLELETGLLDEARFHQEVVIAADRLDITEEVVRLRAHIEHFLTVVGEAESGVAVGRRLDFLLQEMGRETNTIGSKGSDTEIAHLVVELKTELERIREQVQNVE